MKISAKGRYGLAAIAYLARNYESGGLITIFAISEKLGISKIYLEQVFALLKRAGLVNSIKGSQGGYQLAVPPRKVSVYDIFAAVELTLMEKTPPATPDKLPEFDRAAQICVYDPLDEKIREFLSGVTLDDILSAIDSERADLMYYI